MRIAVGIGWHFGCNRGVLRGIERYARTRGWHIQLAPFDAAFFEQAAAGRPDGAIVDPDRAEWVPRLEGLRCPIVSVLSLWNTPGRPGVAMDNVAVGRLAAEYFLGKGFASFGFVGSGWAAFSEGRERGFRERLAEAGERAATFDLAAEPADPDPTDGWGRRERLLSAWLGGLPKPVGVLAMNDVPGQELARCCATLGLHVPDEVAILGVDNDDVFCELARPSLSSVDLPWEAIGVEAAKLLERMAAGHAAPAQPLLLPPSRVVTRGSTDVLAIEDAAVARAVRFIREHAHRSIGVDEAAAAAAVSRRVLEKRFRRSLRRSPLEEIRLRRIELAKDLLVNTDLPLGDIAERCGFATAQRFSTTFRQLTGDKPIGYRKRFRLRDV